MEVRPILATLMACMLLGMGVAARCRADIPTPREQETLAMIDKNASARIVLKGVPRIGCYDSKSGWNVEENAFPSCLRAFLQYKGQETEINKLTGSMDTWHKAYINLMGASGAMFRLLWKPGWGIESMNLMSMAPKPLEPIQRAFESIGYPCEILLKRDYAESLQIKQATDLNEAACRKHIRDSLSRGVPVIAIGVVGPEFCLITGYDEGEDDVYPFVRTKS